MNARFLGIDTSAYTTSVAAIAEDGTRVQERRGLQVEPGARGLRQSEAFFRHVQNLPELIEALSERVDLSRLDGIAVSARPRPREDSYMPVFEAGRAFARTLAAAQRVPLLETSHQENHIEAVLDGAGRDPLALDRFLAVHFSGGTSEILCARATPCGYDLEYAAGSRDLKAGQLIDRTGVRLGLAFPCGPALEALAKNARGTLSIAGRRDGTDFHFSGQENIVEGLIRDNAAPEEIALALFKMIAKTLEKSLRPLSARYGTRTVVFGGGVMSNAIIREELERRLVPAGFELIFAPARSADNALGTAALARRVFGGQNGR